ncbi:hypothetical protein CNR22_03350 [Sphingobacteriaceae bacterium]|nr:hypothetical protein CNR22_03350 [Sphingobacteriaceae bacterium]
MDKQNNVQQQVDAERKKEHVSVLERIRRRTGLLVGIVGLALVIFILESLLGSGASIFGGNDLAYAGSINGKKIDRQEFASRYEMQMNNYRQRNQGKEPDAGTRNQAIEAIWQNYIGELVLKPQFRKMGLDVGEDELYENVVVNPAQSIIQNLSDQNGRVNEQFARPDGSLDLVKWRQAVQSVTGDNEMAVRNMELQVRDTRFFEKFRTLVTKGLYVTKAEAKQNFHDMSDRYSVSYVVKKFTSVSDSTIKVSDSDIQKYYNDHSYLYSNLETTRSVEYVTFNVLPSPADLAAVEADAKRAASAFKGKTIAEDSLFLAQESENGSIIIQDFNKKSMIIRDSSVFTAAPGTVFGPYNEGAYFKIYKLEAINQVADSARIRHILVGLNDPQTGQQKRSLQMAKREADSVLVLLKEKKVSFDSLVMSYSDDGGSKTNGGDYGWFDENARYVQPFKDAGLMGTKGNISVVATEFGYHIIEVLDVSKTRHNSYKVAQIFKLIAPSDETNQAIFATASQFAGENSTAEAFDKAVVAQKLVPRVADNIKDGEYTLSGLDGAKDMVKWAYTANKGDVSLFSLADKHIVVKLKGIRNKGILPLDEVKQDVTNRAIQKKKEERFTEEFNTKAANEKSIESIAAKMGLELLKSENVTFHSNNVDGLGADAAIVGTAAGTKVNTISKVNTGYNGVYMLCVTAVNTNPEPVDYSMDRRQMEQMMMGRSDFDSFNALKELSDIQFHKSRIE